MGEDGIYKAEITCVEEAMKRTKAASGKYFRKLQETKKELRNGCLHALILGNFLQLNLLRCCYSTGEERKLASDQPNKQGKRKQRNKESWKIKLKKKVAFSLIIENKIFTKLNEQAAGREQNIKRRKNSSYISTDIIENLVII